MLNSILNQTTANITLVQLLLCTLTSLVLGGACAGIYAFQNSASNKGFVVAMVLLPAVVQMVILLVNGNVGTGVAVAGAFSLVRFRSQPGSAREIVSIFLAMAVGLATGTGYLTLAVLFVLVLGGTSLLLTASKIGEETNPPQELRITVPEALEYEQLFDDAFAQYTKKTELESVKTTNMGSLFELRYRVWLSAGQSSKAFLDELRTLNGNLTVQLARTATREDRL